MTDTFPTPLRWFKTITLLAAGGLMALAAALLGIDDNPPGILLAYMAAVAFVLAFVHPWRTVKQFRNLLFASIIGLALFVLLNNAFAAIGHNTAAPGTIQYLFQGLAVAAFFLATLIFPAAFIIGGIGLVVLNIRSRRPA